MADIVKRLSWRLQLWVWQYHAASAYEAAAALADIERTLDAKGRTVRRMRWLLTAALLPLWPIGPVYLWLAATYTDHWQVLIDAAVGGWALACSVIASFNVIKLWLSNS